MAQPKLIALISAVIGLVPIILGIVGVSTPSWIKIGAPLSKPSLIYGLFRRCLVDTTDVGAPNICEDVTSFKTIQGLQIAGVVILAVGVIIAVIFKLLLRTPKLQLLTPFLPMLGSVLILIGSLLYAKYVIEHVLEFSIEVTIGYSMILLVIACVCGFLATVHFSFNAGYAYGVKCSSVNFA